MVPFISMPALMPSLITFFLEQDLRGGLSEAVELTGQSREVFKLFWSAQQRFFKLLCISMKVCVQHNVHGFCISITSEKSLRPLVFHNYGPLAPGLRAQKSWQRT